MAHVLAILAIREVYAPSLTLALISIVIMEHVCLSWVDVNAVRASQAVTVQREIVEKMESTALLMINASVSQVTLKNLLVQPVIRQPMATERSLCVTQQMQLWEKQA